MNNKRKVVWITGASSGIGAELARQYSNFGVKLILSSRRADVLEQVKSECSNSENIKILPFDLIDFKSMSKLVKSAYEFFGTIENQPQSKTDFKVIFSRSIHTNISA